MNISIRHASKSFGGRSLWENINIDFPTAGISCITGVSGSGKTTLFNCVGALDTLDSGTITFRDVEISSLRSRQRRLFRWAMVGYLFQDYALIPDRSVSYNLALATEGRKATREAMSMALDDVGLAGFERKRCTNCLEANSNVWLWHG
jgi:ABC-type antimicrobial peptide transport system, ATPase component